MRAALVCFLIVCGCGGTDEGATNPGGDETGTGTDGDVTVTDSSNVDSSNIGPTDSGPPAMTCGAYMPGPALNVCGATYLGGANADAARAVDIASDGSVLVGGIFDGNDFGKTPVALFGGGKGAILRLSSTAREVLSITRLGGAVNDLEVNPEGGAIVACGDFGVAVLDATAATSKWNQTGAVDRCAIGRDGSVAALSGKTVTIYDPSGAKVGSASVPEGNVTDVAIDAAGKQIFAAGWSQKNVGGYCEGQLQVAALYAFGFDGTQKWKNWGWSAAEAAGKSQCADTRSHVVAVGRDGKLYFAGHSAGGNSIFANDPRDISAKAKNATTDAYDTPYNTASNHITWFGRFGSDGVLEVGQFLLTRLSSGKGNTIEPNAIAADEKGNVIVGGAAASGIADGDKLTISGTPVGDYKGGNWVAIVGPSFGKRLTWTTFTGTGTGTTMGVAMGKGVAAAVSVFGEKAVTAGQTLITVNPLQNKPGGNDDGFVAAWPAP